MPNMFLIIFGCVFQKLNEPIRKAIYNKKIAPKGKKPNFYTMKEGVEKIRRVIKLLLIHFF